MTIFDGVSITPPLSPTMQNVLTVVTLIAKTIVGAEKSRQERLAGESKQATTLDEVMQQAGLNISGLHEVLVQLMGGTEEAKKAASLILDTPDPAALLRLFMEKLIGGMSTNTGPIVTPPPSPGPTTPPPDAAPAASSTSQNSRPDSTAAAANGPAAGSPWLGTCSADPPTTAYSPTGEQTRPSLVAMVQRQLGALRRRMNAHEAALDLRLKRAEAELGSLRQELRELHTNEKEPTRAVDAPAQEQQPSLAALASTRMAASPALATDAPVVRGDAPAVLTDAPVVCADSPATDIAAEVVPEVSAERDVDPPLPIAASEHEVARAVELIAEFANEVEDHHQQSLARVVTVEREVSVMRALVQLERQAAGASSHA